MAAQNNRVYYAVHAVGFAALGSNNFKPASGVQNVGLNTTFNLEQVFQLGQLDIYDNIENIPNVEMTLEKVLDGAPLLQHLATQGATVPTLNGRYNNQRCMTALAYYDDENSNASGTPLAEANGSGMYISSINFTLPVDGNCSEAITLVGNDLTWGTGTAINATGTLFSFLPTTYTDTSSPVFGTVLRRQHVVMSGTKWPTDIPGISASGTNNLLAGTDGHQVHVQSVNISVDLGRQELFELGKRGPYHRFADFPTEVTTAIEVLENEFGTFVNARAEGTNVADREVYFQLSDNTRIRLGTKNKLQSTSSSGGDTGGGNRSTTYNYSNFNHLTVFHPRDPAGLTE